MSGIPPDFDRRMLQVIPDLRAYAQSLSRNPALADDIVQDALLSAWSNRHSLRELERIKPWLLSIVRNSFLAHLRKHRSEVEDIDGTFAANQVSAPAQPAVAELRDVRAALETLPLEEREAIALICVDRLSYKEAAEVCGCPVGTMKSRVNRARSNLLAILKEETIEADAAQPLSSGRPARQPSARRSTTAING